MRTTGLTFRSACPNDGQVVPRFVSVLYHRRQGVLGRDGEHETTAATSGLCLDVEAEQHESALLTELTGRFGQVDGGARRTPASLLA